MHILQKVKKMWCFCVYADIFVCEFCLVATKQHPTVIVTKCTHSMQNNNTFDSIVQEIYWRRDKSSKSIIAHVGLQETVK